MGAPEPQAGIRLRLETSLDAPPERAFAAFVDAERLRYWRGPAGFTVVDVQFDAVEGRDYAIAMQPPEGDPFHIRGTFRTVEPPRRLAFTFLYEEPDPDDQETLVAVTFEPAKEGTRIVLDQGPFKTPARRALHRDGWTESLEKLGHPWPRRPPSGSAPPRGQGDDARGRGNSRTNVEPEPRVDSNHRRPFIAEASSWQM